MLRFFFLQLKTFIFHIQFELLVGLIVMFDEIRFQFFFLIVAELRIDKKGKSHANST